MIKQILAWGSAKGKYLGSERGSNLIRRGSLSRKEMRCQ